MLLLAQHHAGTQVAAKIPDGKEKPQYQFVYFFTGICVCGDKRCPPPWHIPLFQSPSQPGDGGPVEAGGAGQCWQPDTAQP